MNRAAHFVFVPLLVVTASLITPRHARAEEGPYPVWWSPKLELESLDKIHERLARPIWHDGSVMGMVRQRAGGDGAGLSDAEDHADARTCKELLTLQESGFVPDYPYDRSRFEYFLVMCTAIRLLESVQTAATGHVRPLLLDEKALAILPAVLTGARTCDEWQALRKLALAGRTLGSVMKSVRLGYAKFVNRVYIDRHWYLLVDILAYGDFNGDGVDDVLLAVETLANTKPLFESMAYYVLSRSDGDSPLEIVVDGVLRSVVRNECRFLPPVE